MTSRHPIYIGTILLERNRHQQGKRPSFRVSEWVERFRADGFDGMELWENHVLLATEDERKALIGASGLPVAVLNAYASFEDAGAADRGRSVELAACLDAGGVKFNLGRHPERWDEYIRNARQWITRLGRTCRPLCECHPGTVVEDPAAVARMFDELGGDQPGAIVHPFHHDPERLRQWFDRLGGRIVHAHVQFRLDGQVHRLAADAARNREVLAVMRQSDYTGSFTLEFAEGMNQPDENIEGSYRWALEDMAFLRENLS